MMQLPLLGALTLHSDASLTVTVEDWSQVRSPGRAARRRKQGKAQRIRYIEVPDPKLYGFGDTLIGHPRTIDAAKRVIEEKARALQMRH